MPTALIQPTKSDNTQPAIDPDTGDVTFAVATYYFPLNPCNDDRSLLGVAFKFDAALAATLTIEASPWDEDSAALTSTGAGDWIPQNPTDAQVMLETGATATGTAVTIAGTNAGACTLALPRMPFERARAKLVVTHVGVGRCAVAGKL